MRILPKPYHYFQIHTYSKKLEEADVEKLLLALVKLLGMTPLSSAIVKQGISDAGYTGVIIIEQSHIAIHCFDELSEMWIDILSCKQFNKEKVTKFLNKACG